jgi:hypothetical protein
MEHEEDRQPKGACPAVTTASFECRQDSLSVPLHVCSAASLIWGGLLG